MINRRFIQIPCIGRGLEMDMAVSAIEDGWTAGATVVLGIVGAPLTGRLSFCEKLLKTASDRYKTVFREFDASSCDPADISGHTGSFFIQNAGLGTDILRNAIETAGTNGGMVIYTSLAPLGGRTIELGWYCDDDLYMAFRDMCQHVERLGVSESDLKGLGCFTDLHDPGLVAALSYSLNPMTFRDKTVFLRMLEDWRGLLRTSYREYGLFDLIDELDERLDILCGLDPDNKRMARDMLDVMSFNDGEKPPTKDFMDLFADGDSSGILEKLEHANLIEIAHSRDPSIGFTCTLTPLMMALRFERLRSDKDRWTSHLKKMYRAIILTDTFDMEWRVRNYRMNNHAMLLLVRHLIESWDGEGFDRTMLEGIRHVNPGCEESRALSAAGIVADGKGYIYSDASTGETIRIENSEDIPTLGDFIGCDEASDGDATLIYSIFLFKQDIIDGAGYYAADIPVVIHDYLCRRYGDLTAHRNLLRFSVRILTQALGLATRGDGDIEYYIRALMPVVIQLESSEDGSFTTFLDRQTALMARIDVMLSLVARPDIRSNTSVEAMFDDAKRRFADLADKWGNGMVIKVAPDTPTDYLELMKSVESDGTLTSSRCDIHVPYMTDVSVYAFSKKFGAVLHRTYGTYLLEIDPEKAGKYLASSIMMYEMGESPMGRLNTIAEYCRSLILMHELGDHSDRQLLNKAESECNSALWDAQRLGMSRLIGELRLILARIMILEGRYSEADANIASAESTHRVDRYRLSEARGDLLLSTGDAVGASEQYRLAISRYESRSHPWNIMVIKSKLYHIYITRNMRVPNELASELNTYCASASARRLGTTFRKIRYNMTGGGVSRFFL